MSHREATNDSNPPLKAMGEGRILTNWQALATIGGFLVLGTLAWAAVKHDQVDQASKLAQVELRMNNLEAEFATQHDLLIRLGLNVDYLAAGRRGPVPSPTVNISNPP